MSFSFLQLSFSISFPGKNIKNKNRLSVYRFQTVFAPSLAPISLLPPYGSTLTLNPLLSCSLLRAPRGGWIGDPVKTLTYSHKNLLRVSTIIAKWLKERSCTTITEKTQRFIPWFGQVQNLPTSTLWRPNGRGLQSTPLKRSKDPLEYHGVLPCLSLSHLRGISTNWSLSPLHLRFTKKHGVREGSNTHKSTAKRAHTRPRFELKDYLTVSHKNGARIT
jgi:hypothetical protein